MRLEWHVSCCCYGNRYDVERLLDLVSGQGLSRFHNVVFKGLARERHGVPEWSIQGGFRDSVARTRMRAGQPQKAVPGLADPMTLNMVHIYLYTV